MKILHIGVCAGALSLSESALARELKRGECIEIPPKEKYFNEKIQVIAKAFTPDFVFLQNADTISLLTLEVLRQTSKFIVNWTGDVRQPMPEYFLRIAPFVDYTCFTDMWGVEFMRKLGFKSELIPIGYDEKTYYPKEQKKDIDIVFQGNHYNNHFPLSNFRLQAVEFLQNTYGNRFKLFGSGWRQSDGRLQGEDEKIADIYRRSKIAIDIPHFDLDRYWSDRRMRIMGCGTTCLAYRNEGIGVDFKEGENIVTWKTLDELRVKIDEHLESKQIGEAGERLVRSKHTYKHMVNNLMSLKKAGHGVNLSHA